MDEFKHYIESPKELQGPDMDQTKRLDRAQETEGLDTNRRVEDVEDISGPPQGGNLMASRTARRAGRTPSIITDTRTGRRYYAEEIPPGGDDDSGGKDSDSALIEEAESDLQKAEDAGAGEDFSDDPGSDAGGTDDDESDQDAEEEPDEDDSEDDSGDDADLPPWLKGDGGGGEEDSGPPPPPPSEKESRRRDANRRSSTQKKRREGVSMSLSDRARTATAGQRRHFADNNGHTDGGPYGEEGLGEQEPVFITGEPGPDGAIAGGGVPGTEPVADPVPGDGTISNSDSNLVASLQRRIQQRNAQQQRDLIAWEQITGRTLSAGAVETPTKVNPTVQTDPELTGKHFEDLGLDDTTSTPKDASVRAFRAFDRWLQQTTGRTARQHGNAMFIRRSAARFCQASGVNVESMFPALGVVLREARRNEGTTRRSTMQRRADEKLDVAAPQDRIDVEKPVADVTDAEAQASQFDLGDFGGNAGDNIAEPEMSVDSQIWAPGEGQASTKSSNRKADGMTAVRYAEAYIRAGLAPNTPDEKWKIAGLAQTMRHGTIVDRTALLDAINNQRAAARRTAGKIRGTGSSVPPGFGQRQLTAGMGYTAANDTNTDSALFFKG